MRRANQYWRLLGTGFSFTVFGLVAVLVGLAGLLLRLVPVAGAKKQVWIRLMISKACATYICMMNALGLLSYSLDVKVPASEPGALLIANHPTLLDAVFILAACTNLCCIVKQGLFENPFTAAAVRVAGYIPASNQGFADLSVMRLAKGESILIFPEGTRNQEDSNPLFMRGAANIAVVAQCKVIPVVIRVEPRTLQKHDPWYRIPPVPPHFSVHSEPPVIVSDKIDTTLPRTVQYRHFTRYLGILYQGYFSPSERASNKLTV